jgi:hypothetical protein
VFWSADRAKKFGQLEKQYRNGPVCVTGFISVFHGQPDCFWVWPSLRSLGATRMEVGLSESGER